MESTSMAALGFFLIFLMSEIGMILLQSMWNTRDPE